MGCHHGRQPARTGRPGTRGHATGLGAWPGHGRGRAQAAVAPAEGIDRAHGAASARGQGLCRSHGRGANLHLPRRRAAQPRGRQGGETHRRLVLQRLHRGGSGGHGGHRHARPEAIAPACRSGRERQSRDGREQGREKVMLLTLADAALRSALLGGVVWLGLSLLRAANPYVQKASWTIVLVASLSMPLMMQWATLTITVQPAPAAQQAPAPVLLERSALAETQPAVVRESIGPAPQLEVDRWAVATVVYICGAGLLLL